MTFSAVIVAAGSGTRAGPGQAKQWRVLAGKAAALVGRGAAGRRGAKARDRRRSRGAPAAGRGPERPFGLDHDRRRRDSRPVRPGRTDRPLRSSGRRACPDPRRRPPLPRRRNNRLGAEGAGRRRRRAPGPAGGRYAEKRGAGRGRCHETAKRPVARPDPPGLPPRPSAWRPTPPGRVRTNPPTTARWSSATAAASWSRPATRC